MSEQTYFGDAAALRLQRLTLEEQIDKQHRSGLPDDDPALRELESQLLQVTFDEDSTDKHVLTNQKAPGIRYADVPVYFVTNRTQGLGGQFGLALGAGGYTVGVAATKIPVSYEVKTDLLPKTERTITLVNTPLPETFAGSSQLLEAIGKVSTDSAGRKRRVLLFVHGYNSDFSSAIIEAARLATAVRFPVIPFTLDWASAGAPTEYWHDEDVVRASTPEFTAFLAEFLKNSPAEVDIVCHSMGSRIIVTALAELARRGEKLPALKRVVFAAGDIAQAEFVRQWAFLRALQNVEVTSYVSDHDVALRASSRIHTYPRLGDARPSPLVFEGGATVDASTLGSKPFDFVDHSYLYTNPRVGTDIGAWIDKQQAPVQRGLEPLTSAGKTYYAFP